MEGKSGVAPTGLDCAPFVDRTVRAVPVFDWDGSSGRRAILHLITIQQNRTVPVSVLGKTRC